TSTVANQPEERDPDVHPGPAAVQPRPGLRHHEPGVGIASAALQRATELVSFSGGPARTRTMVSLLPYPYTGGEPSRRPDSTFSGAIAMSHEHFAPDTPPFSRRGFLETTLLTAGAGALTRVFEQRSEGADEKQKPAPGHPLDPLSKAEM